PGPDATRTPPSAIPQSAIINPQFVGASPGSTDIRRTLWRLCHELAVGAAIGDPIPEDYEKLRQAFPVFLTKASAKKHVVILIDAINQFDASYQSSGMYWLPNELPANARILLSALPGLALEAVRMRSQPPEEVPLPALNQSDAQAIIDGFLARYRKTLEPNQRAALLAKTDAGTPLYLLAALEELRTLGTRQEIDERISDLPGETQTLFVWILKRLQADPGFRDGVGRLVGDELVPRFAALLAASRYGLSQRELTDLLDGDDPHGNVAALLSLLRPHLMRRGILLDFYHQQFHEAAAEAWLSTEEQCHVAHEQLAGYFRGEADPLHDQSWQSEDARPFVELPFHLLRVGDVAAVGELARAAFLHRKADLVGDIDALVDARQMAQALADAGPNYWDDLLHCADVHCELVERLQHRPELLERMIRFGRLSQVEAFITAEPDRIRRGLLALAASTLLAQEGEHGLSERLRREALDDLDATHKAGLASALLTDVELGLSAIGGSPREHAASVRPAPPPPDGQARVRGPFSYVLLGHLVSLTGIVLGMGVLSVGCVWWSMRNIPASWPTIATIPVSVVSFILSVTCAFWVFSRIVHFVRQRSARITELLHDFRRGVMASSPEQKHRIAIRGLRFHILMKEAVGTDTSPGDSVIAGLLDHDLLSCGQPADAAKLIQLSTALDFQFCDTMAKELRMLHPTRLASIFQAATRQPEWTRNAWQLLRIYVLTSDITCNPGLLMKLHTASCRRDLEGESPKHKGKVTVDEEVRLLRRCPPAALASALLKSPELRPKRGYSEWRRRLSAWRVEWTKYAVPLSAPICRLELLLCAPVFGVCLLGFIALVVLVCSWVLVGVILFSFHMAVFAWTHDYWRLSSQRGAADASACLQSISEMRIDDLSFDPFIAFSSGAFYELIQGKWLDGGILRSVLAHAVLSGRRIDLANYPSLSQKGVQWVIRCLVSEGLVSRPADVVLATMNDRALLTAVLQAPAPLSGVSPRHIGGEEHRQQLRRVLPLGRGPNLALVVALSLVLVLACAGGLGMEGLEQVVAVCMVLYFAGIQHMILHDLKGVHSALFIIGAPPLMARAIAGLIRKVFSAAPDATASLSGGAILPRNFLWIVLFVLYVTNLLVPALIRYWRGSNLLYPTQRRLWLQRALVVASAAASSALSVAVLHTFVV
ncbi:MAG: hypothetical protein HQ559_11930, partial [Lentisphaerae bacterium]|nr:hypothetical protein [Lentisphaerota bacterium]